MIRIAKPTTAPPILRERGARLAAELCRQVEAGEAPTIDRDVYGAREVKQALSAAQHDKCCFCESKLGHAQPGDIEHYRPKKRARQSPTDVPAMGYYWLAYAWNNLYLSCALCNRRHKQDFFPLENPERRVSTHTRALEIEQERPIFIDPGAEDPAGFIEFRREYAAPVAENTRGAATIKALDLNRTRLVERRRDQRQLLLICLTSIAGAIQRSLQEGDPQLVEEAFGAVGALITAAGESEEYSSMTRSLLHEVAPWHQTWEPPAALLLEDLRAEVARGHRFQLDHLW